MTEQYAWIRETPGQKFFRRVRSNRFLNNLREYAEEHPVETLMVVGSLLVASGRLINTVAKARGSHAYARQVNYRIRRNG